MTIIYFSQIKQYLEKIILYFEDLADKKVVRKTDFNKGKDFISIVKKLGIR